MSIDFAARERVLLARVGQGALKMDGILPPWFRTVDPAVLEMSNCYRCTLGQAFANYDVGLEVLWPIGHENDPLGLLLGNGQQYDERLNNSIEHGFTVDTMLGITTTTQWRMLRDAWIAEINRRREVA